MASHSHHHHHHHEHPRAGGVAEVHLPPSGPIILRSGNGVEVHILRTGASIQKLLMPDRDGGVADIVLGFDDESRYSDGSNPYFGSVVGRVANRIANATFSLDGKAYRLSTNEAGFPGTLHGGQRGFDKVVWEAEALTAGQGAAAATAETTVPFGSAGVRLTYRSADGEEGYPGNLLAEVHYVLSHKNKLTQRFLATSDAPTVVNLAQHSYFNLAGHDSGSSVLDHVLKLHGGSHMLPVDSRRIPTGELRRVRHTPFDFTRAKRIGAEIDAVDGPGWSAGYDHCFVLHGLGRKRHGGRPLQRPWWQRSPKEAVTLHHPPSGRTLEIETTAPGLQLYTGNFLNDRIGKGGATYPKYSGLCLETQGFPNAPNTPSFPSAVLRPGETYRSLTVYKFKVKGSRGGGRFGGEAEEEEEKEEKEEDQDDDHEEDDDHEDDDEEEDDSKGQIGPRWLV